MEYNHTNHFNSQPVLGWNANDPLSTYLGHGFPSNGLFLPVASSADEPNPQDIVTQSAHNQQRRLRQCQWEPEWDQNRALIKRYYLEQRKTLPEVQEIMKTSHGFDKRLHQYKKKFDHWGWQKKLPQEVARYAAERGKRRRDEGKDTLFSYGKMQFGQDRAAASVKRSKTQSEEIEALDLMTPEGLTYRTPSNYAPSPEMRRLTGTLEQQRDIGPRSTEPAHAWEGLDESTSELTWPRLTWGNLTLAGLPTLVDKAQKLSSEGDSIAAERAYLQAAEAYKHLMGSTHEETVKTLYQMANFYAEQNRMLEADKALDRIGRDLVRAFGTGARRFTEHVLHTIKLLNGWGREVAALAYLSNFQEQMRTLQDDSRKKQHPHDPPQPSVGSHEQFATPPPAIDGSNPADLDYNILAAQSSSEFDPQAKEEFLHATINHCQSDFEHNEARSLRAWTELLKLYQDQVQVEQHSNDFDRAAQEFRRILNEYHWHEHKLESLDVMQALLELAAAFLKSGHSTSVSGMFQNAVTKAEAVYGEHEERTIWIMISIGLVYQNYRGWYEARVWFNKALSAAMDALGEDDGITQSLLQAREKQRFSYISDEGKPFKTIFGVAEIRVRPGRLHLD